MILLVPFFAICILIAPLLLLRSLKANATRTEMVIATTYCISMMVFVANMSLHSNAYFTAIDPVDMECYTPFSGTHAVSILFYFFAFHISALLVWARPEKLPPLATAICAVFLLIGIVLGIFVLLQVSAHDTSTFRAYADADNLPFLFAPVGTIAIGVWLLYTVVITRAEALRKCEYPNRYLSALNHFLALRSRNLFWIVLLLLPVYVLVTLILLLFDQETDSIAKVFTDTATWRFSQQAHPPVLDHKGHYLCTVAASGNPAIVKPLRFGKRNGKIIIVNRQLLVANAFEELLQDFSPKGHRVVRRAYDRYGLNLSKMLNNALLSTLTYLLMKPLEWFFVMCLYLFCTDPERKIKQQYPV